MVEPVPWDGKTSNYQGYTWKEYMYFLLDTLPEETKQSYLEKLEVSREFWKYKEDAQVINHT